jgi:DNA primase small subunit
MKVANENDKDSMQLPYPLHPMIERCYGILEPLFCQYILPSKEEGGQGLLASPELWTTAVLDQLPPTASTVREKLLEVWSDASSTPLEKWKELQSHLQVFLNVLTKSDHKKPKKLTTAEENKLRNWCAELVFRYTYPRLDVEVSRKRNHLLKAPFCIHPKTGRVCVPIGLDQLMKFDPLAVPTVSQLLQELDEKDHDRESKALAWTKTSAAPYFQQFQREFLEPLSRAQQKLARNQAEEAAALTGDF